MCKFSTKTETQGFTTGTIAPVVTPQGVVIGTYTTNKACFVHAVSPTLSHELWNATFTSCAPYPSVDARGNFYIIDSTVFAPSKGPF